MYILYQFIFFYSQKHSLSPKHISCETSEPIKPLQENEPMDTTESSEKNTEISEEPVVNISTWTVRELIFLFCKISYRNTLHYWKFQKRTLYALYTNFIGFYWNKQFNNYHMTYNFFQSFSIWLKFTKKHLSQNIASQNICNFQLFYWSQIESKSVYNSKIIIILNWSAVFILKSQAFFNKWQFCEFY